MRARLYQCCHFWIKTLSKNFHGFSACFFKPRRAQLSRNPEDSDQTMEDGVFGGYEGLNLNERVHRALLDDTKDRVSEEAIKLAQLGTEDAEGAYRYVSSLWRGIGNNQQIRQMSVAFLQAFSQTAVRQVASSTLIPALVYIGAQQLPWTSRLLHVWRVCCEPGAEGIPECH